MKVGEVKEQAEPLGIGLVYHRLPPNVCGGGVWGGERRFPGHPPPPPPGPTTVRAQAGPQGQCPSLCQTACPTMRRCDGPVHQGPHEKSGAAAGTGTPKVCVPQMAPHDRHFGLRGRGGSAVL